MSTEKQWLDSKADAYIVGAISASARIISHYTWQLIESYIKGPDVALMGLGDGVIETKLAAMAHEITVLEGSQKVIDTMRHTMPARCNIQRVLFEDYTERQAYDTVVGTHVLEHVADPALVLRRVHSWLKPGGRAVFTVPNAMSLHRRVGVAMGVLKIHTDLSELDKAIGHRRVYTHYAFHTELTRAHFSIDGLRGYMLKTVSNFQMKDYGRDVLDGLFAVSQQLAPDQCASLVAFCTKEPYT